MPETPVDEYGDAGPGQHQVRSNQTPPHSNRKVLAEAYASAVEQRPHRQLGLGLRAVISPADSRGCQ